MQEFLAWALLFCVIGMWVLVPWRSEETLRLFNADSDEELMRRFGQHRRFVLSIGLVVLMNLVAVWLALSLLL